MMKPWYNQQIPTLIKCESIACLLTAEPILLKFGWGCVGSHLVEGQDSFIPGVTISKANTYFDIGRNVNLSSFPSKL